MTQSPDIAGLVAELREACLADSPKVAKLSPEQQAFHLCRDARWRAADALEAQPYPPSRGGDVDLHRIWNETLRDPSVTPTQLIIEFGRRCATHQPVPQVTVDEAMVSRAVHAFCTKRRNGIFEEDIAAMRAALTAALTQPATRKNDGSMMR